jgi:hypothetical protein
LPVTPLDVEINIADYEDNTVDIQATILAALEELVSDIRPFIAGADIVANRNDRLDLNRIISKIYESMPGAIFGDVTLTVDGNVVTSYVFENGDIPYLNDVTYS